MNSTEQLENAIKALSGDFEAMNFDAMGSFDAEHFNLNISDPNAVRKHLALLHQLAMRTAAKAGSNSKGLGANDQSTIVGLIVNSKGNATIKVIRGTANITSPLPYILFGYSAYQGNFSSLIKPYLPANIASFQVTTDQNTGDYLFTYTATAGAGGGTDVVRVNFEGLTTYSDMNANSATKYFATKYTLYTVNDYTNGQSQFKNNIVFGLLSTLGNKNQNQLSVDACIMTWDFRYDRANLLYPEQKCTNQFAFIDTIIPCPAADLFTAGGSGFIVTWNMYMSQQFGYSS